MFLDTQSYRALGHNPANPALRILKQHIDAHRVVLHTSDVTLAEVKRQIRENVAEQYRELEKIEKKLKGWRKGAPKSAPTSPVKFDVELLAAELFQNFEVFIRFYCRAEVHLALDIPAVDIFARYFERKPPFDGENSKEFPDAFAIESLRRWCQESGDTMHVVTEDKAMIRAAVAADMLPIPNIPELLRRAGAAFGHEADELAEAVLETPEFELSFVSSLRAQVQQAPFVYVGALAEGEAFEGELVEMIAVTNWSVAGWSDQRLTLVVECQIKVRVEVQYEDRESAMYDHEDDRWVGAEVASTDVEEEVEIEVLVGVDGRTNNVVEAKILTQEIDVFGPSDWEY